MIGDEIDALVFALARQAAEYIVVIDWRIAEIVGWNATDQ